MKAADIPDEVVYERVAQSKWRGEPSTLSLYDLQEELGQQYPVKVVLAKIRQMIAKKRLNGCPCGCRGDLRFPWENFGFGCYDGRENWRERLERYLSGPRKLT